MGRKRKLDSKSPAAAPAPAVVKREEPSSQPEGLAVVLGAPQPTSQASAATGSGSGEKKKKMMPQEAGVGGGEEEEEEVEEVEEVEEEVEVDEDEEEEGIEAAAEEAEEEEEEEDAERDADSIQALLNSFPKDQLVELLRDAALGHEDVLASVHRAADDDPAQRKIFVHGLGWDATTETLSEAFGSYGQIEDLRVVTDRATGKCKGYGFILFSRRSGARAALREPQKKIGNRTTACQLASVGPVPPGSAVSNPAPTPVAPPQLALPPVSEYTQRKIFVSNVGADIDPQKLLQFFAKYGEIEEGPLGLDKVTGKPKGFALFVYKTLDSAKKALQEPHKQFEGVVLHCQKAVDGPKPNKGGGLGGVYGAGTSGGRKGAVGYGAHSMPGGAVGGHVMPPVSSLASLPGGVAGGPGVNPALGQALTAILASQGGGLGLNNILGVGANGSGLHNPGASAPLGGSGLPGVPGGYLGGYGSGGGYGGTPQGGPGRNYMGH